LAPPDEARSGHRRIIPGGRALPRRLAACAAVEANERVCPFCGEPPGAGVFCAACGRNLAAVERLPSRGEWEAGGGEAGAGPTPGPSSPLAAGQSPPAAANQSPPAAANQSPPAAASQSSPAAADVASATGSLAERCATATAAFLAAMDAAGRPGTTTWPTPKPSAFRRAGKVEGWVVRPVDREDFDPPKRYEPGLVLSVDGRFHRLDSELRGWGQRDFPHYQHTVSLEPVEPPGDEALLAGLTALRAAHAGGSTP
jgi:hypothetical protein